MNKALSNNRNLPVGQTRQLVRRTAAVTELISAFESETASVFFRTAPRNQHITIYVLSAMLVLGVVLAAITQIDIVVSSVAGFVVPSAGELYVDPFNQSIVREVKVRAGEFIKKGQALAVLDPTFTQADLIQLQQHMASDIAQIGREEAELAKRPYRNSAINQYERMQAELWVERQAQYKASLANFDGQIASTDAQRRQAASDVEKFTGRLKLAQDAEKIYQPLLDKGYVSQIQAMQSSDTRTEMSRLLADAEQAVHQYRESEEALKGQREAYIQNWFSTTDTQLVADRNDLDTTRDSLEKAQKMQDLTTLDAPEDAIVLKVGKVSKGAIAQAGGQGATSPVQDPLFTLMPLSAPLQVELDILTLDVSYISVGDPVTLKLDAYPYLRHGFATGSVKSISEGSFTLDINNQPTNPYYKVLVTIKDVQLRDIPKDFRLMPGMTLTGDIKTGRRTILNYILEGAMKTSSEAMREPQ